MRTFKGMGNIFIHKRIQLAVSPCERPEIFLHPLGRADQINEIPLITLFEVLDHAFVRHGMENVSIGLVNLGIAPTPGNLLELRRQFGDCGIFVFRWLLADPKRFARGDLGSNVLLSPSFEERGREVFFGCRHVRHGGRLHAGNDLAGHVAPGHLGELCGSTPGHKFLKHFVRLD